MFEPGNKFGKGRPPGAKNKKMPRLAELCLENNFDPLKEFLANYILLEHPKDKVETMLKFMEYLYPKRTRIEGELDVNDTSDQPKIELTQENIMLFIQAARGNTKLPRPE